MNLGNCLNANNDAIVSGQTDILLFDFKCRGSTAVVLLFFLFLFFVFFRQTNIGTSELTKWSFGLDLLRNI